VLGGRFEIEITGVLMEDYDTIFAQKNILKKMGKIWSKVFSREYNMKTADTWNSKLVDLQNQLKMQMGLLTTQ
jgi:hypothetical protein